MKFKEYWAGGTVIRSRLLEMGVEERGDKKKRVGSSKILPSKLSRDSPTATGLQWTSSSGAEGELCIRDHEVERHLFVPGSGILPLLGLRGVPTVACRVRPGALVLGPSKVVVVQTYSGNCLLALVSWTADHLLAFEAVDTSSGKRRLCDSSHQPRDGLTAAVHPMKLGEGTDAANPGFAVCR